MCVENAKQQLAALLIARQVIGNLKESAVPYLIEQLRLARLSFEMFGALSPSEARSPPGVPSNESEATSATSSPQEDDNKEPRIKQPRNVSQAELESSLYRVGHPTNSLLSDVAFKVWSRFSRSFFPVLYFVFLSFLPHINVSMWYLRYSSSYGLPSSIHTTSLYTLHTTIIRILYTRFCMKRLSCVHRHDVSMRKHSCSMTQR